MQFLYLLIGLLCGATAAWFAARSVFTRNNSQQLVAESEKENLVQQVRKLESEISRLQELHNDTTRKLGSKESEVLGLQDKLNTQKQELEKVRAEFTKEFQLLANKIFEEKSEKFTQQSKNTLDIIINPLKDQIKNFELKVDNAYKMEAAERNSLKGEIKQLVEASGKISSDAADLARALKGDQKMHGNWGEKVLDQVLERSGLREGEEYKKQVSITGEDGSRLQPDVIVYLPENRHIIIDSKVSLVAYTAFVNAESEEDRKKFIAQHILSLRSHIKRLSDKNYQHAAGMDSPDFVLLFLPIESSFGVAIQNDLELFNFAWDSKIVIVSPSTLLATLRTVASFWQRERQARNFLEIVEESGKMYDKFSGFATDLINIGKKLDESKSTYEEAMNKFSTGTGNLVRRAEKMRELGAKATKALPEKLVERSKQD